MLGVESSEEGDVEVGGRWEREGEALREGVLSATDFLSDGTPQGILGEEGSTCKGPEVEPAHSFDRLCAHVLLTDILPWIISYQEFPEQC